MTRGRILLLLLAASVPACGGERSLDGAVGPILGHVDAHRALVWYGPVRTGTYTLELRGAGADSPARSLRAESLAGRDGTVVWDADGLEAATTYAYTVRGPDGNAVASATLRTAPAPGAPARVRLALGSCANLEEHRIWRAMRAAGSDAFVLLGDTPYVDSVDLDTARRRHRAVLAVPSRAPAASTIPLWATWDDHDYGRDRGDGTLVGKEATRRAFLEYRPQVQHGEGGQGVYTRVRHGPVEVFLLDTRWFAGLERSPAGGPSCLGARQRAWLEAGLRSSTAPFKVLASGMVWHDKGGRSQDDWATYAAERDALFRYLGAAGIGGCVLAAGDVHACQHAVFEDTGAGYPLHAFVVSPLHDRAWRGGDRRHPARRWGTVQPHVFLLLDVDARGAEPTLTATWTRADGRALHRVQVRAGELAPR